MGKEINESIIIIPEVNSSQMGSQSSQHDIVNPKPVKTKSNKENIAKHKQQQTKSKPSAAHNKANRSISANQPPQNIKT
jgi:hypothetical protein